MKILGIIIAFVLLSSVITPYAFADRFSEWIEIWKKQEEIKAKAYQKKVLNLDYDKIQSKDKGYKKPIQGETKKKHIQNTIPPSYKVVKK